MTGARDRTRTDTVLLPQAPEACASTNFATLACHKVLSYLNIPRIAKKSIFKDEDVSKNSDNTAHAHDKYDLPV